MDRVSRLVAEAGLKPAEAILIHKPSNIFYLSGFTGEGLLVIAQGLRAIVTDFRYTEQAQQQAPGWQAHNISTQLNHIRLAAKLLAEQGVGAIRFEDDHVTVKSYAAMESAFDGIPMAPLAQLPEKLRTIKDEQELALIEKACSISCQAFDYILGYIKPGLTEKQIRLALDYQMLTLGAETIAFDTIVASGPNGSLPHAIPGDRQVQRGDLITLDFGAKYGRYCADMTRTVALGEPGDKLRHIYDTVLEAQMLCQDALAPGKDCRAIDRMARDVIAREGYGEYFGHGLGHAVGIDIHEEPRLSQTATAQLAPGMVMTVEPGIYLPGIGGVRIENSCAITQTGARSLVSAPRELIIL
ncbi:MAG: aminopeptidase P family protein [Clostridiales bacterium]|nr:aminopeptidase P family protein [Clostridiales bacterium]